MPELELALKRDNTSFKKLLNAMVLVAFSSWGSDSAAASVLVWFCSAAPWLDQAVLSLSNPKANPARWLQLLLHSTPQIQMMKLFGIQAYDHSSSLHDLVDYLKMHGVSNKRHSEHFQLITQG